MFRNLPCYKNTRSILFEEPAKSPSPHLHRHHDVNLTVIPPSNMCKAPFGTLAIVFVVPIDATCGIQMLYVFVDIKIDTLHFLDTVRYNFEKGTSLALVSTIQFVPTLQVWHSPPGVTQPPRCNTVLQV